MSRLWLIATLTLIGLSACNDDGPPTTDEAIANDVAVGSANEIQIEANLAEPKVEPPAASDPAPKASAFSASGYRLIGTEPFWGGTVTADRIVYSTPDNQSGETIQVRRSEEPGREIYSGTLNERPFVLTLSAGPCSDGMSDNVHAFTASLQVDGETRQGCANPRQ